MVETHDSKILIGWFIFPLLMHSAVYYFCISEYYKQNIFKLLVLRPKLTLKCGCCSSIFMVFMRRAEKTVHWLPAEL